MRLTALTRTVTIGRDESAAVVHLAGRLEADTAPLLRDLLVALLGGGYRHLVIEVTYLEAADLTGLAALASAARRARARGGTLCLAGATGAVARALRATELTAGLVRYADLAAVFTDWSAYESRLTHDPMTPRPSASSCQARARRGCSLRDGSRADHLVVLLGDQFPPDRAGHHLGRARPT